MSRLMGLLTILNILLLAGPALAQKNVQGRIIDAYTREPIEGASITCNMECKCGCSSNADGAFQMNCRSCTQLTVTQIGYAPYRFNINQQPELILLEARSSLLEDVVVSANRGIVAKRIEAPVAIAQLNPKTIQETKALSLDQLLNKISGVNMVDLGNEQHQMSIRQPMTTKSLFLYLEDGIPIRTTGLYNHNALLEMNMTAIKSMEVIKGPSSSLYGSEAIGGAVNVITVAPTALPTLRISLQGNDIGYKRAELQASITKNKTGISVSAFYAKKNNKVMKYSDFDKSAFTVRVDHSFSNKLKFSNSFNYIDYYSDMPGGVDSTMFANRKFINPQTFTYRLVKSLRNHSTLKLQWNDEAASSLSFVIRKNEIGQNPAYRIRDDYRRVNGVWRGDKTLAHGEINSSSFKSFAAIVQHKHSFNWQRANIIAGLSMDLSPSDYLAEYIRINKDTVLTKYSSYTSRDSILTNYATRINNYAMYINGEMDIVHKLRLVASLRFDRFDYSFDNKLSHSAFSGSSDTINRFSRLSSKIGFTYNLNDNLGFYANYSEGFVPPQVTEMYTGVKVPELKPSVFINYEIGGWMQFFNNKVSADFSFYILNGKNEIISVRLDDGSFANQNAGSTKHKGIEAGIWLQPVSSFSFRFSGSLSEHRFVEFVEKGVTYNGKQMNNAPSTQYNTELWYKPSFLSGLRFGAELQRVGKYFTDADNTATYEGYCILNLRTGYKTKHGEVWLNALNVTDSYYSTITTRSAFGYNYRPGDPRNFNVGISVDISSLLMKK